MKKIMLIAGAAMIGVGFLTAHANAQGVPQTVDIAKVDVQKVAAGYRASKVIGSNVLNEANETIGKIDDLLVTRDGKEPYAVLSIGGFLGMGKHDILVQMEKLKFVNEPVRTTSTTSTTTGSAARPATSPSTTTSTSSTKSKWYPDHAVLSGATKESLKSMAEFKFD